MTIHTISGADQPFVFRKCDRVGFRIWPEHSEILGTWKGVRKSQGEDYEWSYFVAGKTPITCEGCLND